MGHLMLETGIKNTTYAGQLHWPLQDTHDAIFPVRCSRCGQNYTPDVLPQNICGKIIKEVLWLNLTWKAHQMTHRCIFSKLKHRKTRKALWVKHYEKCTSVMGGNELRDPFLPNWAKTSHSLNGHTQRSLSMSYHNTFYSSFEPLSSFF